MKKLFVLASLLLAVGLFGADRAPRGPVVVADFVESAQTTAQSQTFTPAADGTFRISTYAEVSGTLTGTSAMAVLASWTDDLQAEAFNSSAGGAPTVVCSMGEAPICQGTVTIRAKAGDAITVGFGTGGTISLSSGCSYTAYAIIEQL